MLRRLSILAATALLTACAGLGAESWIISEETEIEMGAEFHLELLKEMPEYQGDPAVTAYVKELGDSIVPNSDRPGLTFHFTVLDTEQINAFAILGGYVYVTKGLLMSASSGAEVASVIAHEIGHVTARHGVQSLETYVGAELLSELLGGGDLGEVVSVAIQGGYGLTYSKDQEREADELGVEYANASGFNAWGMVNFFEYLNSLSGEEPAEEPDEIDSVFEDLGELFSTHPPTDERIANVKAQLSSLGVKENDSTLKWEITPTHADIIDILANEVPPEEEIPEEETPEEENPEG